MLLIPILLPFLGGLWLFFQGSQHPKAFLYAMVWGTAISVGITGFLAPDLMFFGYFPFDISLVFALDPLGLFFSVIFSIIWIVVLPYALDYLKQDSNQIRFFSAFLSLLGAMLGLCYSYNLVTFYLFFELVSLCSVILVAHEQTETALLASKKFFYYSMAGGFLGMVTIFYFYSVKTANPGKVSMTFTEGGIQSLLEYGDESLILGFTLLAMVGFGCKAGMFPLHGWLKTAHPIAPAPASAILSGITTKAGVLAIVRILYYVVGPEFLTGTYVQYWGLSLSILTIFMGSMLAYREKVLKTRLACSTVSQVSYVLFALFLFQDYGFIGAMLQVLFHAMSKTLLFLCAGTMIHQAGVHKVAELSGLARKLPGTFFLFTVASLSLVGLPLTGGFVSKWYISLGAVMGGTGFGYFGVIIIIVSALLTAGYLLPICTQGFFSPLLEQENVDISHTAHTVEDHDSSKKGEAVTYSLAILICVIGTFPLPIINFLQVIANSLGLGGGL